MSFKRIERAGSAVKLGPKHKQVTGFFIGIERPRKGKYKKSVIYCLQTPNGGRVNVWGCASINQCLLHPDGTPETVFLGKLVRFTFTGAQRLPGKSQPMKKIDVEIDNEKSLPARGKAGKDYILKPS